MTKLSTMTTNNIVLLTVFYDVIMISCVICISNEEVEYYVKEESLPLSF